MRRRPTPPSSRNPGRARAGTGGAGGPGWKRGEGGPIRLFGTLEMRSKIGKMPKWTSVLEKERKNPGYVANRQFPGQGAWKDIKAKLSGMSPLEQVKAVNVLINRWPYRTDMDVWGVMDYWETPVEFFQKSGDCEDFAIAKYFALRDPGLSRFPDADCRAEGYASQPRPCRHRRLPGRGRMDTRQFEQRGLVAQTAFALSAAIFSERGVPVGAFDAFRS